MSVDHLAIVSISLERELQLMSGEVTVGNYEVWVDSGGLVVSGELLEVSGLWSWVCGHQDTCDDQVSEALCSPGLSRVSVPFLVLRHGNPPI